MRNVIFFESPEDAGAISAGLVDSDFTEFHVVTGMSPEGVASYLSSKDDVGSFAIVCRDDAPFGRTFPNNCVKLGGDVGKVCSQVTYILSNFGREVKRLSDVFVTSDTHFFHQNIIRYCDRPWNTAEEMNDGLVERWNSVVGKDDTVIHLGDFSFGNRAKVEEAFSRLNGKIDLVLGNHDRLKVKDYYAIGFHRVYDRPILFANFFILSHAPVQWVKDGGVYCNVYGHVHDMEMYRTVTANTFCACVERHGYRPVPFREVELAMRRASGENLTDSGKTV